MKFSKHWPWLALGLIVLIVLMSNPLTRGIVIFLLPLGFRPDDIIVVALVIIGLVISQGWIKYGLPDSFKNFFTEDKTEDKEN